MKAFDKSVAHVDRSGAGFGNNFTQLQTCKLAYAQANIKARGVACELAYEYRSDIAEATFTLVDAQGNAVGCVKFAERWQNFGDEKKPQIHAVFNYDLYVGTEAQGWLQVAFAQVQENRNVPPKIVVKIADSLSELARFNNLFPKVQSIAFGKR